MLKRRALFLAVNGRDNEIPSDFRARLFALTRRDQFPFDERFLFAECYAYLSYGAVGQRKNQKR